MKLLGSKPENVRRNVTRIRPSVLIEISDEAYKQNTVYCPWQDIVSSQPDASTEVSPHERPASAVTS